MDCVQPQNHVIMLKLIDEDGDWVELVILCVHGGLWRSNYKGTVLRLGVVQSGYKRSGARIGVKEIRL